MAESIESFVKTLREEGVEAGRNEASRLVADAEKQAADIVAKARAEADAVLAKSREETEQLVSKAKADLDLVVRDTIARLRTHLSTILSDLLEARSEKALQDQKVVANAVAEILRAHVEQVKQGEFSVTVSDQVRDEVAKVAMKAVADAVAEGELRDGLIRGGLSQPGFAYSVEGATVQVDASSVAEHLQEMVSPVLRAAIERQTAQAEGSDSTVEEESNAVGTK